MANHRKPSPKRIRKPRRFRLSYVLLALMALLVLPAPAVSMMQFDFIGDHQVDSAMDPAPVKPATPRTMQDNLPAPGVGAYDPKAPATNLREFPNWPIKAGDSLAEICVAVNAKYGLNKTVDELYADNKGMIGSDRNLIMPGDELVIIGRMSAAGSDVPRPDASAPVTPEDAAPKAKSPKAPETRQGPKPFEYPFSRTIACTSHYEPRWGSFHYGVDLGAPNGEMVHAIAGGRVLEAGKASGYGKFVVIQQGGYRTIYGHIEPVRGLNAGDTVQPGDAIGKVRKLGDFLDTKDATWKGFHLHITVKKMEDNKPTDPEDYFRDHGLTLCRQAK